MRVFYRSVRRKRGDRNRGVEPRRRARVVRRAEQKLQQTVSGKFKIYKLEQAVLLPWGSACSSARSLQGQERFDCILWTRSYDGDWKGRAVCVPRRLFCQWDAVASRSIAEYWFRLGGGCRIRNSEEKSQTNVCSLPESKHEGVKESWRQPYTGTFDPVTYGHPGCYLACIQAFDRL